MTDPSAPPTDLPVQVLIVDDNEDAATSLSMLLDLEDISSTTAPDAETALDLVRDICPPLLLIDIGLPGMNGYDLAQRLRQLPRMQGSTLIALTGRDVPAGEEALAGTPFDQMWAKPFDPKRLLSEIKAILARSTTG